MLNLDRAHPPTIVCFALSFVLAAVPVAKSQDSPDALPKVVQHSQPVYPPLARQTLIQGDVRVKVTTNGESVTSAEALSGHPLLGKAAEENVRTWKFAPHNPSTFIVMFRYKLMSGDSDVQFLDAPALVQIEAAPPQLIIDYAWLGLGTWKAQLTSEHGKSQRTLMLWYSGPKGEWLHGCVMAQKGDKEETDFGHREKDFLAFTVKLRQPDEQERTTFFVGNLKEDKIVGTFVNDGGVTGKWTATRLQEPPRKSQCR